MWAEIGSGLAVTSVAIGGYIFLDDRHVHKESYVKEYEELAGWVKKEATRSDKRAKKTDKRFISNQLRNFELQGLCKKIEWKRLCQSLRQQLKEK